MPQAIQTWFTQCRHGCESCGLSRLYAVLKGLTDKMRNDFNVMKDLAVHTRLTPEQRQREVGRLIDYIHK